MDWATIAKLAKEGVQNGVNQWLAVAVVQGGKISATTAVLPPGSLVCPMKIEPLLLQRLLQGQVPPEIARVLARALSSSWDEWASLFSITMPGAFPSFAAFPGPMAPPTPAIPVPLAAATAAGEAFLKAPIVSAKLIGALKPFATKATGSLESAVKSIAAWLEGSYNDWKSSTIIGGLMGQGPVPTFAPPYVPVGPVMMGTAMSLPGKLFTGPRFGRPSMK